MNIVILGAGYAGITAALRLARRGGSAFDITLVTESPYFTERIRLHEIAAGHVPKQHAIADLLGDARVTLRIGRVDDVRTLAWDRLVLALGSRVDDRVSGVREHTVHLDSAVMELRGRVVVVGGGLTGIEVATELAETHRDIRVTLVSRGELGADFSEAARGALRDACDRLGVEVLTHASVQRVEARRLVLEDGDLSFDSCVWAAGFLASSLPAGLALQTNQIGQVVVDPLQRAVGNEHVFAIGDLAAASPMGCKRAIPSGAHVADTILAMSAGHAPKAFDFNAPIYCVSLGRHDGVIQRTSTGGIVRGRFAAWIKERICRFTLLGLRLERLGLMSYSAFEAQEAT